MKKGLVMQIQNKALIVMTQDGQFMRIPKKDRVFEIGEEITFPARSFHTKLMYSLAVACTAVVIVMISLFSGFSFFNKSAVAAYVTMDINPSIELAINDQEIVIETKGLNVEGMDLLKNLDIVGESLTEAVDRIIEQAEPVLDSYVETDGSGNIVITSMVIMLDYEDDEQRVMEELTSSVQSQLRKENEETKLDITVLSVPKELKQTADHSGISSGKMAVKLLAEEQGIDIPLEQLQQKSIQEITNEVEGLSQVLKEHESDSKQVIRSILEQKYSVNSVEEQEENPPVYQEDQGTLDSNLGSVNINQSDDQTEDESANLNEDEQHRSENQNKELHEEKSGERFTESEEQNKEKVQNHRAIYHHDGRNIESHPSEDEEKKDTYQTDNHLDKGKEKRMEQPFHHQKSNIELEVTVPDSNEEGDQIIDLKMDGDDVMPYLPENQRQTKQSEKALDEKSDHSDLQYTNPNEQKSEEKQDKHDVHDAEYEQPHLKKKSEDRGRAKEKGERRNELENNQERAKYSIQQWTTA